MITAFGETKSLWGWLRDARVRAQRRHILYRLSVGWDPQRALTERPRPGRRPSIKVGDKYQWLEVVEVLYNPRTNRYFGRCRCRCGGQSVTEAHNLTHAITVSCGCYRYGGLKPKVSAFGESKSMTEWSKDGRCKVSFDTVRRRLKKGITAELAITLPSYRRPGTSQPRPSRRRGPSCQVSASPA